MNDFEHVKMNMKHWNICFIAITTIYMVSMGYELAKSYTPHGGGMFLGTTEGKIIIACFAPAMIGIIVTSSLMVSLAGKSDPEPAFLSKFKTLLVARQVCCVAIDLAFTFVIAQLIYHVVKMGECLAMKDSTKKTDCESINLIYLLVEAIYFMPTIYMLIIQIWALNIDSMEIRKLKTIVNASTKATLIDHKDE